MTDNQRRVDVIIVGGGLVATPLARALCVHGLETAVVDTADLSTTLTPAFDGRCSAIAAAAAKLFQAIGVWDQLAEVAQPIRDIRVELVVFDRQRIPLLGTSAATDPDRLPQGGIANFHFQLKDFSQEIKNYYLHANWTFDESV